MKWDFNPQRYECEPKIYTNNSMVFNFKLINLKYIYYIINLLGTEESNVIGYHGQTIQSVHVSYVDSQST